MDKLNQSFPDPSKFKQEKEFNYAAMTASVYKKVIAELLMWIDSKSDEVKHYERKLEGETSTFNIGE